MEYMTRKDLQKNNEKYFEAILNNLSGGLISVDTGGKIVYINPMAYRILHMEPNPAFIGLGYDRVFANYEALVSVIKETIETNSVKRRAEIKIMHANTPLIIGYSTILVKSGKNEKMGVAVIFQDISFITSTKTKENKAEK